MNINVVSSPAFHKVRMPSVALVSRDETCLTNANTRKQELLVTMRKDRQP
jgi:hypothetical protein